MKNPPVAVTTWRASDGSSHVNERSAQLHQAEGDLWAFIRDTGRQVMSPKQMCDWLVENDERVAEMLVDLMNARKMPP